ncbi:hypothetical protein [Paenibacillus sp. J22TS3]|uniref:hypothetical protein n=1 Tax=Paenibacillus sp. J22TS3 TaxID=2807192 RepID=UPI001B2D8CC8|nr:hypothetical protein [Paenibacillus sp. J22TS3]GIP20660.1 hypothetical protein J22TS3_09350 [Paenibacillus sp. J22TS3]
MIEAFIKQTISMLEKSDIRIHQPDFRKVVFEDEKKHTVFIEVSDVLYGRSNLSDNLILQLMIFFGILDAKIDSLYPELENDKFEAKFSRLPESNDQELILKQLFRILKLFRNVAVHKRDAVSIENNTITCNSGIKKLVISKLGLELIYSVIFMLLNPLDKNEEYFIGILRQYYDDIKGAVFSFKDAAGEGLPELSNGIRLKWSVRYQVDNPSYEVDENYLTIKNPYDTGYEWYGVDYFIDGGSFVLPGEALNSDNQISISDLQAWKI